jgi:hypothetical protein
VTTFGEIDIIPAGDDWEPPMHLGKPLVLVIDAVGLGAEPGYHVSSGVTFGVAPYPDLEDERLLAVVIASEPFVVAHPYYGEAVIAAGRWRLYLRHDGTAPKAADQ